MTSGKTLGQIIDDVQDGEHPEYDDLRYAVVALSALHGFAIKSIMTLAEAKRKGQKPFLIRDPEYVAEERFKQFKAALAVPPKTYVGVEHDPDTEECQNFRRMAKGVMNHVLKNLQDPDSSSTTA